MRRGTGEREPGHAADLARSRQVVYAPAAGQTVLPGPRPADHVHPGRLGLASRPPAAPAGRRSDRVLVVRARRVPRDRLLLPDGLARPASRPDGPGRPGIDV